MEITDFTANYMRLADDELLCLWAEQNTLIPEAVMALDNEIQRRGLKKQNAARVKKRLDELAAREENGPLVRQVATAKYERNMRHFVGVEEPAFHSPYGNRDIRSTFALIRHKYRVWKAFQEHTGHWPIFSICYCFGSWITVLGAAIAIFGWVDDRKWSTGWSTFADIASVLVILGAREMGARLMRKLDWKRWGT